MAYQCPRCGGAVQRGAAPGAALFGLLGALLGSAFGSFQCKKCGAIPRSEFPPEVQKQMTMGSITLVAIAALVLVVLIVLLIYIASIRTS